MKTLRFLVIAAVLIGSAAPVAAQAVPWSPLQRGSDNIEVLGHIPLGPRLSVADMELEQEMPRPFAYVARMQYGPVGPKGLDIINLEDQVKAGMEIVLADAIEPLVDLVLLPK